MGPLISGSRVQRLQSFRKRYREPPNAVSHDHIHLFERFPHGQFAELWGLPLRVLASSSRSALGAAIPMCRRGLQLIMIGAGLSPGL
jgi:hypothetical protein